MARYIVCTDLQSLAAVKEQQDMHPSAYEDGLNRAFAISCSKKKDMMSWQRSFFRAA